MAVVRVREAGEKWPLFEQSVKEPWRRPGEQHSGRKGHWYTEMEASKPGGMVGKLDPVEEPGGRSCRV